MYTDFLCASCGFYIIFNFFYLSGAFRESVDARLWTLGTAPLLCYNPYARVRTFISVLSRISAAPPSFSFSLTNISSSISSHLTSNFHHQSINCPMPQYHPTISVLLLTLQGVKSPFLLSSMFFLCHYYLVRSTLWRAPLLRSRGTHFFPSGHLAPCFCLCSTLPSSHPHTFSENFTRTNIYTHRPHISSSHTHTPALLSAVNVKRKEKSALAPLLRAPRACSGRHGSCITTAAPRAAIGDALVCIILYSALSISPCRLSRPQLEVHD
jgi:hypothetical protein